MAKELGVRRMRREALLGNESAQLGLESSGDAESHEARSTLRE